MISMQEALDMVDKEREIGFQHYNKAVKQLVQLKAMSNRKLEFQNIYVFTTHSQGGNCALQVFQEKNIIDLIEGKFKVLDVSVGLYFAKVKVQKTSAPVSELIMHDFTTLYC